MARQKKRVFSDCRPCTESMVIWHAVMPAHCFLGATLSRA